MINIKPLIRVLASIGLTLVLLLITVSNTVPLTAKAGPKADVWDEYPLPQEGKTGDWVLTGGETGVPVIFAVLDSRREDYQHGFSTSANPLHILIRYDIANSAAYSF